MSGLFISYEEDYKKTLRQLDANVFLLRASIDKQNAHAKDPTFVYHPPPATGPTSRSQQLQDTQLHLAHLKDLITSMGYEASDLDPAQRASVKAAVDDYRRNVVALEREVSQLRQRCTAAERADLLHFGEGGDRAQSGILEEADAATRDQRLMSLQTTEKLQGGTSTLLKAEAQLHLSNVLGRDSLSALRSQTEQMHSIQMTTGNIDAEISQSREVIRRMQHTALKQKLCLFGTIFMLIALICSLFYFRK